MPAIQTRPINGDEEFLALQQALNRLLARHGFPLVQHKGSASWLAGAGHPGHQGETWLKLLYCGPNQPFAFGLRRSWTEANDKLKEIKWPLEFAVMPAIDVPFVGFRVPRGQQQSALQRVEKILGTLPVPHPSVSIPLDEDDSHLDDQLDKL